MQPLPPSLTLKVVLLAGAIAGLTLGLFHLLFTEPLIDQAILYEEQLGGTEPGGEETFSRETQKLGLVMGSIFYGLLVASIFGPVYARLRRQIPGTTPIKKALALAFLAYWTLALLPFFKYPANPPGVGEVETIYYRQGLYVAFLLLALLGTVGGLFLYRVLSRKEVGRRFRHPLTLGAYGLYLGLVFLGMPTNPDPITIPSSLLWGFRALSLLGQTLFWGALGALFGFLWDFFLKRWQASRPQAVGPGPRAR